MVLASRISQGLFLGTKVVEPLILYLFHPLSSCRWVRAFFYNYFTYFCITIPHTQNSLNFQYKIQKAERSYREKKSLHTLGSCCLHSFFLGRQPLLHISCGDLTLNNSINTKFRFLGTETFDKSSYNGIL